MECEITVGFFLARKCRNHAATLCSQCQRPACSSHLAADGSGLCVQCAPVGADTADPTYRNRDYDSGTTDIDRGRWHSPAHRGTMSSAHTGDPPARDLTDEDIRSFDEISEFDKTEQSDLYDS